MKSIMPGDKKDVCYICFRETPYTELHHIFGGTANRKKSDKAGLTVHLCYECHRGSHGVHMDALSADYLHRLGQFEYEKTHSREEFRKVFGKSYL